MLKPTGCSYLPKDPPLYGLPEPWKSYSGVEVIHSVSTITAQVPLSQNQAKYLSSQNISGVYDENNVYHQSTAKDLVEDTKNVIAAVDKMTGEWLIQDKNQDTFFLSI